MHLTPNISYPLMIVVSALMLPVMIVRFYMGVWQMVLLDLPLIIASFWSISAFYVMAQRELHPKNWKRSILAAAHADGGRRGADGDQYARRAGGAVRRSERLRPHPEVRHEGDRPMAAWSRRNTAARAAGCLTSKSRCGTYFLAMAIFAIDTYNFLSIPFLLLFVGGYYWAGFATLYRSIGGDMQHLRQSRLRNCRRRRELTTGTGPRSGAPHPSPGAAHPRSQLREHLLQVRELPARRSIQDPAARPT